MEKRVKRGYNENKNILIEEYKSVYFYIPKNGCTTLKRYLFRLVGIGIHEGSIHNYAFPFVPVGLLKTEYNDYLKFTFVRNPWSRMVSCYNSKIRSPEFTNNYFTKGIHNGFKRFEGLFYGDMPFNEFVEAVCSIPDSNADPHFVSQLFWLTDSSGELLPNYIGRLEKLEPSIDDIYQNSGLSLSNMGTRNRSKQDASYTEYYDEILKDKVRERYAGDIEAFGYLFDPNSNLKPIGFVDEALHKKIASSKFLVKLLKEKSELNHTMIDTNRNLEKQQGQRKSTNFSKFLNIFNLKKLLSNKN